MDARDGEHQLLERRLPWGVYAGDAYVDVGTLNGYREANQLLDARRARRDTTTMHAASPGGWRHASRL
ncbi:MAG: hypothetical protein AB7N65_14140 [Vicinamibacterales bacterium]